MLHASNRDLLYDCLEAVQKVIDELGIRGVIIGGVAVALLSKPRATLDVDAMMLLDTDRIPDLLAVSQKHGLIPRISDIESFARRSRVVLLKHEPTGIGVDISLGILPFEVEVVDRAIERKAGRISVCLAGPEDLIILKAVAHRPVDFVDIQSLVTAWPNLDRDRIRKCVQEFAEVMESPELWDDIAPLLGNPQGASDS